MQNWRDMLDFVQAVVNSFPIGPTLTRIGMVRFSNSASLTFTFEKYATAFQLTAVITQLTLQGGETNMADAFRVANKDLFSTRRDNVKTICIMITDGKPNVEVDQTFVEINKTKALGIEVYAIGIASGVRWSFGRFILFVYPFECAVESTD